MAGLTGQGVLAPARSADLLLLAALFIIAVATYPYAALIVDSGRDLAWGLSIARGEAFPLYGPSLNGLWQLGPIWYYLLAIPLLTTGSVGATAGLIGLLAACKIPLAYRVGASHAGAGLGLAFAAMISLPGWSTLSQMVLSHTSLTEVGVLATLALSLRAIQRCSAGAAAAAALALSLAMHAHPTALVAAPAVAFALWRSARLRDKRHWIVLAVAAFLAPFLPALFAEANAGWPQWHNSTGYFGGADYLARAIRLPLVLHGLSIGQWQFAQEFLLSRPPLPERLLGTLWALPVALAVVGLLWRGWRDRLALAAAGLLLWSWVFVLLLRDQTPVWMIYAWSPVSCALLGLGWQSLWRPTQQQAAARTLATVSVLLGACVFFDRMVVARGGLQFLPGDALADVASPVRRDLPVRFWLPAWGHDTAFREFCAGPSGLALHGELAAAVGFAQGVGFSLHCPPDFELLLAGTAQRTVAGIPTELASQLDLRGPRIPGGYTVVESPRVLAPERGERIALHRRYRVDDFSRKRLGEELYSVDIIEECSSGDILVVANLLPGLNSPFAVSTLTARPTALLVGETLTSRYYACPAGGTYFIKIQSLDAAATDVFVLRTGAG